MLYSLALVAAEVTRLRVQRLVCATLLMAAVVFLQPSLLAQARWVQPSLSR